MSKSGSYTNVFARGEFTFPFFGFGVILNCFVKKNCFTEALFVIRKCLKKFGRRLETQDAITVRIAIITNWYFPFYGGAQAVRRLREDEKTRASTGAAGRRKVEQNHTWDKVAAFAQAAYAETLSKK